VASGFLQTSEMSAIKTLQTKLKRLKNIIFNVERRSKYPMQNQNPLKKLRRKELGGIQGESQGG
jgi:hypothetical protein